MTKSPITTYPITLHLITLKQKCCVSQWQGNDNSPFKAVFTAATSFEMAVSPKTFHTAHQE